MIFKCMCFVSEIKLCFLCLLAVGSKQRQDSSFDIVIGLWPEQMTNCGLISSRASGFFFCSKISASASVITHPSVRRTPGPLIQWMKWTVCETDH